MQVQELLIESHVKTFSREQLIFYWAIIFLDCFQACGLFTAHLSSCISQSVKQQSLSGARCLTDT